VTKAQDQAGFETKSERTCGLTVVGTIGILDRAASRQLIDLPEAIDRLKRTTFRISLEILEELLRPL